MATLDRGPHIFPAGLSRLQERYLNPYVRPLAPYLPGFALLEHRGRKSGKPYTTPVNVIPTRGKLVIALGHGVTDWCRNILAAGEAHAHTIFRHLHLINPRIVTPDNPDPALPLVVRIAARRLQLFVADIARD
ncbi:nitroreductase family deazaflavin-dependent oxidoreductase [Nocardia huaxiensis]|uniref:Nitroreductase family deazaflavin-dependent oxidoreductase n=1 Tax=Nocardia huaxiensis TaxID=2755382 RepID=A0A7D6ZGJ9_9NOCA|nr:nitroreductase family deazaflavin-dependent oxidoreductase [Nocardia huaxiensis]QLY29827.1 nitroreductase family deazaflavin-dependent oxidoreductase [Nocardia huaxiensis]UFS96583.1 nitroreductase family deazaflavin-dependent oxidoreductase [Nocardia huaxiensis]